MSMTEKPPLKPPSVMALIDELENFDYIDHEKSIEKVIDALRETGYDTTGVREALIGRKDDDPEN